MKSITRTILDIELKKQFKKLKPGIVLDVGAKDSPYKDYIPHTKYLRLDISKKTKPDIVGDIQNFKTRKRFDIVIMTEVLEHLSNPKKAIDNIYKILHPGGVCILSTCFFYPYHPDPKDYYRFTKDSLYYLFKKFKKIEIYPYGNRFHVIWLTLSVGFLKILNIFNPIIAKIRVKKTNLPLGFVVYAVK